MKRDLFVLAFASLFIFLSSCKKGDDGEPGTANVKYSAWFTATPWKKDTVYSVWGFNYYQKAPEITKDILDKGTVLVYGKLIGYNPLAWPTNQIGQLPISLTYQQGSVMTDTWSATAQLDSVKIRFVNDKNYYNVISAIHQFRYIVIPGGVPAGRGVSLEYADICKMYDIPE